MTSQTVASTHTNREGYHWTDHLKLRSLTWWTWAAFAVLLGLAMCGITELRHVVLFLASILAAAYFMRHRSLSHFPTQVRVAYFLWMAASFIPQLVPMFWIQSAGTISLVLFGYCPMARSLLLLPFNRTVPLSPQRVMKIIFHPPTAGSVKEDLAI